MKQHNTKSGHQCSGNGLSTNRRRVIVWTSVGAVYETVVVIVIKFRVVMKYLAVSLQCFVWERRCRWYGLANNLSINCESVYDNLKPVDVYIQVSDGKYYLLQQVKLHLLTAYTRMRRRSGLCHQWYPVHHSKSLGCVDLVVISIRFCYSDKISAG